MGRRSHACRQRSPIHQQAQGVQGLPIALADHLPVKAAPVQGLGLAYGLHLVGLGQGFLGQVGEAGGGHGEVQRPVVPAQVAGLAYPLPQLLPLAGAGVGRELAAQLQQVLGGYLLGIQCVNVDGEKNSEVRSKGLYTVPPAWVLGGFMLSGCHRLTQQEMQRRGR